MNNAKLSLHRDSRDWIVACLDPYHDVTRNLEGMPDNMVARSYVRVHNQTINVSSTGDGDQLGITFTGAHGVTHSFMNPLQDQSFVTGPSVADFGPIQVILSNSATNPNMANVMGGTTISCSNFATMLSPTIPSRLIGLAIEVHDVTARLYQKGTICTAPINGSVQRVYPRLMDTNVPYVVCPPFLRMPLIPTNVNLLQLTPGSVIGPVAKGAYTIAKLQEPQMPARCASDAQSGWLPTYGEPLWYDEVTLSSGQVRSQCTQMNTFTSTNDRYITTGLGSVWSGFQPFRSHITGLAAESELRITIRTIVEYFPELNTPSEVGIATMSPAFDPAAFIAYQETSRQLPISVPVSNNASGDHWRMAVRLLQRVILPSMEIAPPILAAIGQPMLAAAVTAARAPVKAILQPAKRKKRPQPPRRRRIARR